MYPEINLGGLLIPTYGLMMYIGIVFGLIYVYHAVVIREKISKYTTFRLAICIAIGGIFTYFGAAFFDSLFHSIEEGKIVLGGITYLGGVVVGFPVTIFLIHKLVPVAKGRALYTFSLLIPGIVLAHGFGRIGCFFAGCCYGKETTSWIGVTFPGMENPVIPTQLIEAGFEFILFILMLIFDKKIKGHQLELYFFVYSIFRFILEFFRGDDRGATFLPISPAQFLDLLCLTASILIMLFYKQKVFKKTYQKCLVWMEEAKTNGKRKRGLLDSAQSPQEIIKELYEMKEKGIITEEEYNAKRADILKDM